VALTGRAGLVALLGVLVVAISPAHLATLVVLDAALVVGIGIDVALAGGVRHLVLQRGGGTGTRLGESVTVTLDVVNTGRRRVRGRLRDAWAPSAAATPASHALDLPAGERRRLQTVLLPTRRGDRRPALVTIRSIGPLGLAARQGRHWVPWAVRVLPPFTSRRFLPGRLARLRQLDGAVPTRVRGQGTEFDSLREYVDGDDVRSIDWRATARRQDVTVRTWRPERDRRIVLVLDTGRTSAARVGDIPRLDCSLDAALLLAAVAARAGDRVDLLAVDRVQRASVEGASRTEVLPRLVQAMAALEPALVESDARRMVAEVLRRARQRSLIVLFTSLDAAVIETGLLPVLSALTSRHLVLLAAVADPRVVELAAGRGDAEAVYGASAAEQTGADRRRVSAQLARQGVSVVEAPPNDFAPAVTDAYLELKAAGRL
jgi:uncharacterized protein (DUF58 family)